MLQPFDRAFNAAVLVLANRACPRGWDVADEAPASLEAGLAAFTRDGGRPTVWSGGSEATIFGDPEINYAFRAWHDATHYRLGAAFDYAGEQATCRAQCEDVRALYGHGIMAQGFKRLLVTEIMGQLAYHMRTGEFPAD